MSDRAVKSRETAREAIRDLFVDGKTVGNAPGTKWCGINAYSAQSSLTVQTATPSYTIWARAFSHEIDEALADPTDNVRWQHGLLEIDDPVELLTYPFCRVALAVIRRPHTASSR